MRHQRIHLVWIVVVALAGTPTWADVPPEVRAVLDALPRDSSAEQVRDASKLARFFINKTIDENEPGVIAALGKMLLSQDSEPANEAGFSLEWAGIDALAPAREALRSDNEHTRSRGALLVEELVEKFKRENRYDKVKDKFEPVVAELAASLHDKKNSTVDLNAITALGEIGVPAKKELLRLLDMPRDTPEFPGGKSLGAGRGE